MRAMELCFDAELRLGRHAAILPELQDAHRNHPLRERFCEQLMVALYRSGRQADALGFYRLMWQNLSEELGIEPSPSLQRLEHAILSHAPHLDGAALTAGIPAGLTGFRHPGTTVMAVLCQCPVSVGWHDRSTGGE